MDSPKYYVMQEDSYDATTPFVVAATNEDEAILIAEQGEKSSHYRYSVQLVFSTPPEGIDLTDIPTIDSLQDGNYALLKNDLNEILHEAISAAHASRDTGVDEVYWNPLNGVEENNMYYDNFPVPDSRNHLAQSANARSVWLVFNVDTPSTLEITRGREKACYEVHSDIAKYAYIEAVRLMRDGRF